MRLESGALTGGEAVEPWAPLTRTWLDIPSWIFPFRNKDDEDVVLGSSHWRYWYTVLEDV